MPHHKQVTTCLRGGGPISKTCTCDHCCLTVCSVCGSWDGALTTECPGESVGTDRRDEVFDTNLDFTDERGWHLDETSYRSPRFEKSPVTPPAQLEQHTPLLPRLSDAAPMRIAGCACGWRTPREANDSDTAFAEHLALARLTPDVDWANVDRMDGLRHELTQKAVAWVLEDRMCDDLSAALTNVEDQVDTLRMQEQEVHPELLAKLERMDRDFKLASQRTEKRDDEFRQAARKLVAELERAPRATAQAFVDALKEGPEAARDFVDALKKEN